MTADINIIKGANTLKGLIEYTGWAQDTVGLREIVVDILGFRCHSIDAMMELSRMLVETAFPGKGGDVRRYNQPDSEPFIRCFKRISPTITQIVRLATSSDRKKSVELREIKGRLMLSETGGHLRDRISVLLQEAELVTPGTRIQFGSSNGRATLKDFVLISTPPSSQLAGLPRSDISGPPDINDWVRASQEPHAPEGFDVISSEGSSIGLPQEPNTGEDKFFGAMMIVEGENRLLRNKIERAKRLLATMKNAPHITSADVQKALDILDEITRLPGGALATEPTAPRAERNGKIPEDIPHGLTWAIYCRTAGSVGLGGDALKADIDDELAGQAGLCIAYAEKHGLKPVSGKKTFFDLCPADEPFDSRPGLMAVRNSGATAILCHDSRCFSDNKETNWLKENKLVLHTVTGL
jgi:hypothetical protein